MPAARNRSIHYSCFLNGPGIAANRIPRLPVPAKGGLAWNLMGRLTSSLTWNLSWSWSWSAAALRSALAARGQWAAGTGPRDCRERNAKRVRIEPDPRRDVLGIGSGENDFRHERPHGRNTELTRRAAARAFAYLGLRAGGNGIDAERHRGYDRIGLRQQQALLEHAAAGRAEAAQQRQSNGPDAKKMEALCGRRSGCRRSPVGRSGRCMRTQ